MARRRLTGFVIDSSADSAPSSVVLGEPDAELVAARLLEAAVASERRGGLEARDRLDRLITRVDPTIVPFDQHHLGWARDAFRRFGKGRHAAALNLGDCIAYATARHEVLPPLFKGDDFAQTDLERA